MAASAPQLARGVRDSRLADGRAHRRHAGSPGRSRSCSDSGTGQRHRELMTEREQLLQELRPASFAIAYRMLGSVSEAEDVVQEALLRLHQAMTTASKSHHPERSWQPSPRAWPSTSCARHAFVASGMLE